MAGADSTAKLAVVIGGSSKGLQRAVKKAGTATKASGGMMTTALVGVAAAAAVAAVAIAALGAIVVAKFVGRSRAAFVEFEEGMIRIQAIMQRELGPTVEGGAQKFVDLETEIRNVAKASKFTAREVADAASVLALAGLSYTEMVDDKAIQNVVDFSIAAGTDVDTAAGIGIASVKAYGKEIGEMGQVMDVMTNTFTSSFTDLVSLGQAMKFLGPTANAAGVSLEESAAAVGALGNAGLQGTIAGTGLRMSINKLISPTDDSRRAMNRLGLDFFRLTPAGEAAKASLAALEGALTATKTDLESTTAAVSKLSDEMEDLSISQQKNSLQIAQIRMRASKKGRELNEKELETIKRLEMANGAMSLEERKLGIQRQEAQRDQKRLNVTLSDQKKEYKSLNDTMSQQTTGITSLADVVNQLADAGATTAEILEIFSVRGGTAIMALMGQRDGFLELAEANRNATGTMEDFVEITKGSTAYAMAEVRSQFEETMLVVGEFFAHIYNMEGGIGDAMIAIAESIRENEDAWASLASGLANSLIPILEELPEIIPDIIEGFRVVSQFMINMGKIIVWLIQKLTPLIDGMVKYIELSAELQGSDSAIKRFAGGFMTGGIMGGFDSMSASPDATNSMNITAEDVLAMAEGGIVRSPTLALIGEAGPEAVVPLNPANYPNGGGGIGGNTTVINFDQIVINGDANTTASEVRMIIEDSMPKILKQSFNSGARGVI